MRLDWAMLADGAQLRGGLAFVLGGGIDTVNAAELPANLNATLLIRLLLHRTETDRDMRLKPGAWTRMDASWPRSTDTFGRDLLTTSRSVGTSRSWSASPSTT